MKYTTITIGGGNKNFFFSKCCLEFLIINCLKNRKIKKHIHIGKIARVRILFINFLLLCQGIPKNRFEYKNQVKNLSLLTNYKGSIVISSAPILGGLTILQCWKFRLPVLIFDNKFYYLNFSTFLKNKKLVWKNFNELSGKLDLLMNNYEKYSNEYYEHYKFLKGKKKLANDFLINKSKEKYNKFHKKNSVYNNINFFKIIISLIFKFPYLFTKFILLLFFIYIKPFKSNKLLDFKKYFAKKRRILISKSNFIQRLQIFKYYIFNLIEKCIPKLVNSYKLVFLEELKGKKILVYDNSKSTVSLPNFNDKKNEIILGKFEKVFAIFIKNVKFNPHFSTLMQDNKLYINQLVLQNPNKFGLSKGGFLVRNYNFIDDIPLKMNGILKELLTINNKRINKTKIIDKAIFIGGDGSKNWYHWIIEILPKLFITANLPNEFASYPLAVPYICKNNKNFKDALQLFNTANREIFYFGMKDIIFANELIFIEDVLKSPFMIKNGFKLKNTDYSQNDKLILNYSNQFQKYYESKKLKCDLNFYKKVFLARKNSQRSYNQNELIEIVKKYEFNIIYTEELNLLEQISLFSNAKYIVGPPGAAWTGLIFSPNNKLKCLSWLPEYLNNACNFSNLANILNHDLRFITIEDKYNNDKHFNFHTDFCSLNPFLFEKEIKKLIIN